MVLFSSRSLSSRLPAVARQQWRRLEFVRLRVHCAELRRSSGRARLQPELLRAELAARDVTLAPALVDALGNLTLPDALLLADVCRCRCCS